MIVITSGVFNIIQLIEKKESSNRQRFYMPLLDGIHLVIGQRSDFFWNT